MRKFFSVLIISLFILALIIFSVAFIAVKFHQDKLLAQLKSTLSTSIDSETGFTKASIGFISTFPQLSVKLENFYILNQAGFNSNSLVPTMKDTLLSARTLYLELNSLELIKGNYAFNAASFEQGSMALYHEPNETDNYFFLFEDSVETADSSAGSTINLKKISLQEIQLFFKHAGSETNLLAKLGNIQISGTIDPDKSLFQTTGDMFAETLILGPDTYLQSAPISFSMDIQDNSGELVLSKMLLQMQDASFAGSLNYSYSSELLQVNLSGSGFDLAGTLAIMPVFASLQPDSTQISGLAGLDLLYETNLASVKPGAIKAKISLNDGSLNHIPSGLSLQNIQLEANYSSDENNFESWEDLRLEAEPELGGFLRFQGSVRGMESSTIDGNFQLEIPGKQITAWMGQDMKFSDNSLIKGILAVSGKEINTSEDVNLILENLHPSGSLLLSGFQLENSGYTIDLNPTEIQITPLECAARSLNMQINKQSLSINQLSLRNWTKLFANQPAELTGIIESPFLDLSVLDPTMEPATNKRSAIHLPNNLIADISVHIASIKRDRFEAKDITGRIFVKPGQINLTDAGIRAVNGRIRLNAKLIQNSNQDISLSSTVELQEIDLHELLYSFRDFNQSYIRNQDIMGDITGKIAIEIKMDSLMKFENKNITGRCNFIILNGELHDLNALQKVSDYTMIKELESIQFSKIEGAASLEDGILNLQQSIIRSNVADLDIRGKHELGKQLEYKFDILLSLFLSDQAKEGEKKEGGRTKLYLKLAGTESDYGVSYDFDRRREVAADRWKQEGQELKDAFSKEFGKKDSSSQDASKSDSQAKKKKTKVIWE